MADILHRVFHGTVSALTPDRYEQSYLHKPPPAAVGPTLHSVLQEPGQFAHSLDPRSASGLFNLATILFPKMTPAQAAYLQQLKLVEPKWANQNRIDYQLVDPLAANPLVRETTAEGRNYILPPQQGYNTAALAEKLGYTTGNPARDLLIPSRLSDKAEYGGGFNPFRPVENYRAGMAGFSKAGLHPSTGMDFNTFISYLLGRPGESSGLPTQRPFPFGKQKGTT